MLYIIGGAARSGKTILTRRLFTEHNVPFFCVDYFVSALGEGSPELGIQGESPTRPKAEMLWPRIYGLMRNIVEVEPAYTVEGDSLWPAGVAALRDHYGPQIRACFVGYADTTPAHKLTQIRAHSGGVNDWIQHHDDDYVLDLCTEMIEWSQFLRAECQTYNLPYVDVSDDFLNVLNAAYVTLCEAP